MQNILPYNYHGCHIKTSYNSYKIVFIGLQKTEGNRALIYVQLIILLTYSDKYLSEIRIMAFKEYKKKEKKNG